MYKLVNLVYIIIYKISTIALRYSIANQVTVEVGQVHNEVFNQP